MSAIDELNQKVSRTKNLDHDTLQAVSVYAYNETDNKLRGLKINDNNELVVSSSGGGDITRGSDDILTEAQQVLNYGRYDNNGDVRAMKVGFDGSVFVKNNNITKGQGDITNGNGLQQILCYGKDQSGNLDPLNVDNNGHLKITLNDIEPNITSSINVVNTKKITRTDWQSSGSSLTGIWTDGSRSDALDVGNQSSITWSVYASTTGNFNTITLEASNDNYNWTPVGVAYNNSLSTTNDIWFFNGVDFGYRYYRIHNSSGSSITVDHTFVNIIS